MNSRTAVWLTAGLLAAAIGTGLGVTALEDLFRYSPYQDPQDLSRGLWLGVAAAVLILAIPVTAFSLYLVRRETAYAHWKRTLTPEQRAALTIAEIAALEAAHLVWRDHNRDESARLAGSVMGSPGGHSGEDG
jgi:hypothetical protein